LTKMICSKNDPFETKWQRMQSASPPKTIVVFYKSFYKKIRNEKVNHKVNKGKGHLFDSIKLLKILVGRTVLEPVTR
jgi:hypothetical protein